MKQILNNLWPLWCPRRNYSSCLQLHIYDGLYQKLDVQQQIDKTLAYGAIHTMYRKGRHCYSKQGLPAIWAIAKRDFLVAVQRWRKDLWFSLKGRNNIRDFGTIKNYWRESEEHRFDAYIQYFRGPAVDVYTNKTLHLRVLCFFAKAAETTSTREIADRTQFNRTGCSE